MVPKIGPLSERCISYGAPRTQANYNSYTQIIQSPDTVVLLQEMIHDARVVPTTNKPHLPKKVRQLHGDPRGRWEGDTLVVETTNYINGFPGIDAGREDHRTLHACQRGLHQLAGDGRRSGDLDQAVYVHGPP
jgi:hypothetical protein